MPDKVAEKGGNCSSPNDDSVGIAGELLLRTNELSDAGEKSPRGGIHCEPEPDWYA